MTRNSLGLRLFLIASVWSVIMLAIAGFILTALFRQAVERAFDDRLNVFITALVAEIALSPEEPKAPGNLGEPRFEQPLSGWYWQIASLKRGTRIVGSGSLWDEGFDLPSRRGVEPDKTRTRRGYANGPAEQRLRIVEREIRFSEKRAFSIAVAGNDEEIQQRIETFRNNVILTFVVFAVGLAITVFLIVRFGLRPLERMRLALQAIRSGKMERLDTNYPDEIQPLANDLNALLQSNQEIIERSRTHVGNLAHALKTPLSVITNEAHRRDTEFSAKVSEQADVMRTQIAHHLDRAQMAARSKVIGVITDANEVVDSLGRAMVKIHERRGLDIGVDHPSVARFKGERQDLEEMIGNLFDNACKWARSEVTLTMSVEPATREHDGCLVINIDDDGPGLTKEQRLDAVKRGRRLDESVPGSGLGLSIVTELAQLYGGSFTLEEAPIGGLRCILRLPSIREDGK